MCYSACHKHSPIRWTASITSDLFPRVGVIPATLTHCYSYPHIMGYITAHGKVAAKQYKYAGADLSLVYKYVPDCHELTLASTLPFSLLRGRSYSTTRSHTRGAGTPCPSDMRYLH